jgi:hypothetical protein
MRQRWSAFPLGRIRLRLRPMKRKMTPAEQSAEFKRMARELGGDESPEAFDRTLKRIAPGKPAPAPKKKPARAK